MRRPLVCASSLVLLAGCQRAPSVDILGSFFPIWIFCIVIGIIMSVLARWLFIRIGLNQDLGPPLLIYPCMAALIACLIWLVFFH